jgi:hypothetical protein
MRPTALTDLKVWQRSMDLVVALYDLTERYPKSEQFGLMSHTSSRLGRRVSCSHNSNAGDVSDSTAP